jgi:hypothetical protein
MTFKYTMKSHHGIAKFGNDPELHRRPEPESANNNPWHGTWEGDESDLRRIDPQTGAVLERLAMPAGVSVSGLESDGGDRFFCGGGTSGKMRAVRRPTRVSAAGSGSKTSVDSTSK